MAALKAGASDYVIKDASPEFLTLLRSSRGDAVVLLATFLLTVFRDLTEGIVVGFALGAVLFINRMATTTGIEEHAPLVPPDRADDSGVRAPYDPGLATDSKVVVYRLSGAFFFGAASTVGAVQDTTPDGHGMQLPPGLPKA